MKYFYRTPPGGVDPSELRGMLIVIEGPDSSGRSTQINMLSNWLERMGYAVAQTGLKRSTLVSEELEKAQEGNILGPKTMSLFYATDFYDQLENNIIPALRAGYFVIADRYIFTLIVRDMARGAKLDYIESLYSMALVPDAVFYFNASVENLVERTLEAKGCLDYWESGMDIGLSRNWYKSFLKYQRRVKKYFEILQDKYAFEIIDADRPIDVIHEDIKQRVMRIIDGKQPIHAPEGHEVLTTPISISVPATGEQPNSGSEETQ